MPSYNTNEEDRMNDLSLYNIAEEQEAITALLEMDGGEITEDHETLIEQVEQMIAHRTGLCAGISDATFTYKVDVHGKQCRQINSATVRRH